MPQELIIHKSEFKDQGFLFKEITDTLGFIAFYDGVTIRLFRNQCPHMGAKLEKHHLCERSQSIVCPWHKYRYDLKSGALTENPAIDGWIKHLVPEGSHFLKLRNMKLISWPIEEREDSFRILIQDPHP